MTCIEILQIAFQAFRHYAALVENIQVRLMEVVEQVFHVQGFNLLFAEYLHVLDQELFAANTGVAFADDQGG
ncbi:hypothetical protein D3C87_1345510 [compost metagenome]